MDATLFHSSAFDFSVWELWGALLSGGRLVIAPYWVSRSPEDFYALLVRERVTVLSHPCLFPPAELELLSFNTLAERRHAFSCAFGFWLESSLRAIMEIEGCGSEEAASIMCGLEERDLSTKEFYRLMQE